MTYRKESMQSDLAMPCVHAHSTRCKYPFATDCRYIDNAAMQLLRNPKVFDTIVTGNIFGDILSDEASMLTGSLGMLPSASISNDGPGIFEPVNATHPSLLMLGSAAFFAGFGAHVLICFALSCLAYSPMMNQPISSTFKTLYTCHHSLCHQRASTTSSRQLHAHKRHLLHAACIVHAQPEG